jgi:hypothetical protein
MKLDRLVSGALTTAAVVVAATFACGCSSTTTTKTACARAAHDQMSNEAASVPGTTNLMSAQIPGPAPKVGKSHLAIDEDLEVGATDTSSDLNAPKQARPSDGSRRGGGFGTSSK